MCVIEHVVQRLGNELRQDALRLETSACNVEIEQGDAAYIVKRALLDVRAVATRLRAYAKQLDGKD